MRSDTIVACCMLLLSPVLAMAQPAPPAPPAPLRGPLPAAMEGAAARPATTTADAPTARQPADGIVDLEAMVVSGVQPGPGLWQVRRGDHVLWILGTQSPLPRKMDWNNAEIERVVASSQELLEAPSVQVGGDLGLFQRLTLLPTAMKARRDPEGRRLVDIVGPGDHARWLALKARYIGRNDGIEQWRPVFAAMELYSDAVRRSGMAFSGEVTRTVERSAKRGGLLVTPVEVLIPIDNPRAALKEFARAPLDDVGCFRGTLDRIEGDLGNMAARANAWAVGDLATLRDLPYENQFVACSAAFSGAALARRYGIDDLPARMERAWMAAAEAALARNASTVAILPIAQLLRHDGYLSKLEAKGYRVLAPGATMTGDAPPTGDAGAPTAATGGR